MKQKPRYFKTSIRKILEKRPATTDEQLADLLLLVDIVVNLDVILSWSRWDMALAEDWAVRVHLSASDNTTIRVPQMPAFLKPYRKLPYVQSPISNRVQDRS